MSFSTKLTSDSIVIVANGEKPSKNLISPFLANSTLIAADGGLNTCIELGLIPELVIGDFDSLNQSILKKYPSIIQHKILDQNKTDLEKAFEFLFSFPVKKLTVFGALGARIDHTLTNICLLTRYPGKVIFETEYESCMALRKKSIISCKEGQKISLIPVNGEVKNINSKGLKWELNHSTLSKNFIGISNIALKKQIKIHYETGDMVICLTKK